MASKKHHVYDVEKKRALDALNRSRGLARREGLLNGTWERRPVVFDKKTQKSLERAINAEIREYL